MFISTGSPGDDQGFCVVCGRSVRVDPTRPTGDAPCPSCGALLWMFPAAAETSLGKGCHVRLRAGGRFSPVGVVASVDETRRRVRVMFRQDRHVVLVEVSADDVVRSSSPAPPLLPMRAPCSACGAADQLDPWRLPEIQLCVVCRKSPAPVAASRALADEIGRRVTVRSGPFAGHEGWIAAQNLLDGRLMVQIAGFDDAVVRVIVANVDLTPIRSRP